MIVPLIESLATAESQSCDSSTSSLFTWLAPSLVVITLLYAQFKFFTTYISIDASEKALKDITHRMAVCVFDVTDAPATRGSPQDIRIRAIQGELKELHTFIARFRKQMYSIDDMTWFTYVSFILWARWKVPVVVYWKVGKVRRGVLLLQLESRSGAP